MTALRCHRLLLAVHCGRLSRPLARQTGLRLSAAPAGVCPGRSAGRMPGRCSGSPDLPGHLPTLTGPGAQVSGGIYLWR